MKVNDVIFYLDGGTAQVVTDIGDFYIDRRIHTKTPCAIFTTHPDEGSERVDCYKKDIIDGLKEYDGREGNCIEILIRDMEKSK